MDDQKMADGSQNLRPLYGVYFNSSTKLDERDVKNDFSMYGKVFNVKQVSSRVFVNFSSKEDAEQLLQAGTHEKYGEIRKGRFGPKEAREFDNHSISFKAVPRKSNKPFGNPTSFSSHINDHCDDVDEEEHSNCNGNYKSLDDRNDNTRRESPRNANSKSKDNKKSPSSNRTCKSPGAHNDVMDYTSGLRDCTDSPYNAPPKHSGNFSHDNSHSTFCDRDEIPNLVSVFHHTRIPAEKPCNDDCPPPLISTSSYQNRVSLKNDQNVHIQTAYDDSNGTRTDNEIDSNLSNLQFSGGILTRNVSSYSTDDIPPLIRKEVQAPDGSFINVHEELSQYSNQVLIANVPGDTTVGEIEKVLYPLEPAHISNLDITNVRFKIFFFHVVFYSEKEATTAVKQFDGLQLRGCGLTVKKLNDILLLTQFSTVK